MSDYTPKLQHMARLARERPTLLANLLKIYQDQEGLNEIQLAAFLNTDINQLTRLALCRRPRTDPSVFRSDIEQIAGYTSVNPAQLAKLVRSAMALEIRHRVAASKTQPLLAARDRDKADEPDVIQDSTDV